MTTVIMRNSVLSGHQGAMNKSPNPAHDRLLKILQASPEIQAEIDRILDGKPPAPHDEPPTGPLLMGMSAAAKYLGVSRSTLWRICCAGRLQKVELYPGSFRLRRADLIKLAAGERSA